MYSWVVSAKPPEGFSSSQSCSTPTKLGGCSRRPDLPVTAGDPWSAGDYGFLGELELKESPWPAVGSCPRLSSELRAPVFRKQEQRH